MNKILRKIRKIFYLNQIRLGPRFGRLPTIQRNFKMSRPDLNDCLPQGLVIHPTNIDIPAKLIPGPIYDRDKYNKCSICIRYCGSLLPHAWLIDPNTSCKSVMQQRAALLKLLVQLRGLYPSAKILGASELDGKELYSKNIIVSDTMNVLREELSNMP